MEKKRTQWLVVGVMLLIIRITVQVIAEKVMIGAYFEEKIRHIYIYIYICVYIHAVYVIYSVKKIRLYTHLFVYGLLLL